MKSYALQVWGSAMIYRSGAESRNGGGAPGTRVGGSAVHSERATWLQVVGLVAALLAGVAISFG